MMKSKFYFQRAYSHMQKNKEALAMEYGENVIIVEEGNRWEYAIPENYTNYQDGFLVPNEEWRKGMELLNYNGEILYSRYVVKWFDLEECESEKHYLFDRKGRKYTFIVKKSPSPLTEGNPSYFEFIKRVKKYAPKRKLQNR